LISAQSTVLGEIVARRRGVSAFAEVKASDRFDAAAEAIGKGQQNVSSRPRSSVARPDAMPDCDSMSFW
jgi:hypothetical protein